MTTDRQALSELKVFRAFAEVCRLPIRQDSIVKQEPPETDIFCEFEDGEQVAFELTEILDEGVARRVDVLSVRAKLLDLWEQLPEAERDKLRGLNVGVGFSERASKRSKEKAAPEIIRWLLQLPEGFCGRVAIPKQKTVNDVEVRGRCNLITPWFNVSTFGNYRDETVDAIEKKLSLAYGGPRPIELLAHYGLQGLHLPEMWMEDLDELLLDRLDASPFRRVWVFDYPSKTVAYSKPPAAAE